MGPTVTQDYTASAQTTYLSIKVLKFANNVSTLTTANLSYDQNVDNSVTTQTSSSLATLEPCKIPEVGALLTS